MSGKESHVAVLVECTSVIVRNEALTKKYTGGVEAYELACPNKTFCSDGVLTRIGFMNLNDVRYWCSEVLAPVRITLDHQARSRDVVVVDQLTGPSGACDWIVFGQNAEGFSWCRADDDERDVFAAPPGWTAAASRSMRFQVPNSDLPGAVASTRSPGVDAARPLYHATVFEKGWSPDAMRPEDLFGGGRSDAD
jgi:hypothetical protein